MESSELSTQREDQKLYFELKVTFTPKTPDFEYNRPIAENLEPKLKI